MLDPKHLISFKRKRRRKAISAYSAILIVATIVVVGMAAGLTVLKLDVGLNTTTYQFSTSSTTNYDSSAVVSSSSLYSTSYSSVFSSTRPTTSTGTSETTLYISTSSIQSSQPSYPTSTSSTMVTSTLSASKTTSSSSPITTSATTASSSSGSSTTTTTSTVSSSTSQNYQIFQANERYFAGYTAKTYSARVTNVSAEWRVPTANCSVVPPGQYYPTSAMYVGIEDEYSIEQIGTEADCRFGSPTYFAWYEFYPSAGSMYISSVLPGDQISAFVSYSISSAIYTLSITDLTSGK